MNHPLLEQRIELYVELYVGLMYNSICPFLPYHNLDHTLRVVARVKEIAAHYSMDRMDGLLVRCAAWFHDIGYLTGKARGHEQRSAELAQRFLQGIPLQTQWLNKVQSCILSTKLPQNPSGLVEQILCDADLHHLGTEEFFEQDALMRAEMELSEGKIPDSEWLKGTISLFESHSFATEYCRRMLASTKEQNLKRLQIRLQLG